MWQRLLPGSFNGNLHCLTFECKDRSKGSDQVSRYQFYAQLWRPLGVKDPLTTTDKIKQLKRNGLLAFIFLLSKWDSCFHYPLFIILNVAKKFWNVKICHWEPKRSGEFFLNVPWCNYRQSWTIKKYRGSEPYVFYRVNGTNDFIIQYLQFWI